MTMQCSSDALDTWTMETPHVTRESHTCQDCARQKEQDLNPPQQTQKSVYTQKNAHPQSMRRTVKTRLFSHHDDDAHAADPSTRRHGTVHQSPASNAAKVDFAGQHVSAYPRNRSKGTANHSPARNAAKIAHQRTQKHGTVQEALYLHRSSHHPAQEKCRHHSRSRQNRRTSLRRTCTCHNT